MIAAVMAGAGVGSVLRYLATVAEQRVRRRRLERHPDRPGPPLPWATLTVNVLASLFLGWVVARAAAGALSPVAAAVLGAGLASGTSTYSTFAVELVQLGREGHGRLAATYATLSLAVGLAAAWLGHLLGR